MGQFSYEFLKAELLAFAGVKPDSFLNSAFYYLVTGRKGAWLYKGRNSLLVVCKHPHVANRLMVFPELGKADYELTASVLNMLERAENDIQLVRYTQEELKLLKTTLAKLNYSAVTSVSSIEENIMDWRYPARILDTGMVAKMSGASFMKIRNKFRKAAEHVTHIEIDKSNALRMMRAALKFWEGNMIFNEKDTADMSEFYHEMFKIIQKYPDAIEGLLFLKGNKPLGFSAWDNVPRSKTANLFVNLGDTSVRGLSDYQTVTTCRVLKERGVDYLNMGGSEIASLDAFKAKYQPVKSLNLLSANVSYQKICNTNIIVQDLVM